MDQRSHPGLTFVTLRADDESEQLLGWYEAQSRGFHQGRTSDELRRYFGEHLQKDDALLRGVWQDAPGARSGRDPGRDLRQLRPRPSTPAARSSRCG